MLRLTTALVSVQCILYSSYHNVHGTRVTRTTSTTTRTRYYDPSLGHKPYWPGGDHAHDVHEYDDGDTEFHYKACGKECPRQYRHIKQVCGRIIRDTTVKGCHPWNWNELVGCGGWPPDDLTDGYGTFYTFCHFLHWQCADTLGDDRLRYDKAQHKWIFVHIGPCETNQDNVFRPHYHDEDMINRQAAWRTSLARFFQTDGFWTPPF